MTPKKKELKWRLVLMGIKNLEIRFVIFIFQMDYLNKKY